VKALNWDGQHRIFNKLFQEWKDGDNMDTAGPAGSINSSAADLVNWLQVHLNGGNLSGKDPLGSGDPKRDVFFPHSLLVGIPIGWQTRSQPTPERLRSFRRVRDPARRRQSGPPLQGLSFRRAPGQGR
jgi:CubicO group peptidase (beta-lactamase class C family)